MITEELNCETVFTIPVFGGIPVGESTVVTWIIMAALTIISILLVRNLKVENPGKKQLALEAGIGFLQDFFTDILGERGKRYVPYLITVAIYIGVANLIGLLGFKPPTKDLNVTAGLAIMSICLIEYSGFRQKGLKGFVHSFAEPMAIAIRPVSLCMRLFGNVIGAFVVMELIKMIIPVAIPVPLSLYFDIFDGLIQAYVFVFLTSLFIKEQIEE